MPSAPPDPIIAHNPMKGECPKQSDSKIPKPPSTAYAAQGFIPSLLGVIRKRALDQASPGSPPGNGCRSVRSLSESESGSEFQDRNRFPFWLAPGPHGALKLHCRVVSAPPQRYPVSPVRIPSRVLSIPGPNVTPVPSLHRPRPFRATSCEISPATELPENTEANVLSHPKATRLKWGLSRQWQK
jgi:hypothetical protein